ncbi:MAG: PA14 domain-containing protein, partial [Candidatus Promineifilaceae bacterium]|nr:PA14 domain-containing protein [Candidatus Promineifilaceae bacterium]
MLLRAKRTLIIFIAVALLSLGLGAHAAQAADSVWRARYWNNTEMSGAPVLEREEGDRLDYNWGAETPAGPGVNLDNFSAEWTRTVNIDRAGTYRFDAQVDDGVRVYVDDVLVVDEWKLGAARTVSGERYLTAGDHELKVLYFDAGVVARIGLTWSFVSPWPTVFDGWRGEYFNNEDLVGPAVLVRDDEKIDFAWGLQSPSAAVSADHFSARWTRTVALPGGTYVFRVYSDDGVRLWVDGDLVVDRWKDQSLTPTWATVELPGGDVDIRMEYYEAEMFASARLDWVEVDAENGSWMVEYWANPDLDGLPVAVGTADELPIDVDWGYGAPVQQIGADHFSVRWTRDIVFTPGRHRFTVRSDDGVRL